jgi:transketolase C-terminal domain/subunit
VVVLCADLTDSTRASWFREKFPSRFFGFGIAEQDMFGAAAGMALMGKIPYVCTFGVFASGRAWDQVRVSVAYMNLNVKIIGTHGGLSVGEDGATHQAIEEIALMRVLPHMTVVVPADAKEAKRATIHVPRRTIISVHPPPPRLRRIPCSHTMEATFLIRGEATIVQVTPAIRPEAVIIRQNGASYQQLSGRSSESLFPGHRIRQ